MAVKEKHDILKECSYRKLVLHYMNKGKEEKITESDLLKNDSAVKNNIKLITPVIIESISSFLNSEFIFNPLTLCSEGNFSNEEIKSLGLLLLHGLIFNPELILRGITNLNAVEDEEEPDTELKLYTNEDNYLTSIDNVFVDLFNQYLKFENELTVPFIEKEPEFFNTENEDNKEKFVVLLIRNMFNFVHDVYTEETVEKLYYPEGVVEDELESLKRLSKSIMATVQLVLDLNNNTFPEDVVLDVEKPEGLENKPDVKLDKFQVIFILTNIKKELESDLIHYSEDVKDIVDILALLEDNEEKAVELEGK